MMTNKTIRSNRSTMKRRLILDAAAKVFSQHGFADVRLSDIAAVAGTQAGSLYYHFKSREELVDQVLIEGVNGIFSDVVARIEALGPNADPCAKLACGIRAHLETMLELNDYSSAHMRIVNQVPRAIRAGHLKRQRAYMQYWRELFAEVANAKLIRVGLDVSVARMMLLGMLNWTIEWYRPDRLNATEIAQQTVDLLLHGLLETNPSARDTKKSPSPRRPSKNPRKLAEMSSERR
jgi:TetR/AcrR family transcriptional regulator, cholesterol catabolism regulator